MNSIAMVEGRPMWRGADMTEPEEWSHRLTGAEIVELEHAVAHIRGRGLAIADIGPDDFPLPALGPVLARIRREVADGRGVSMISGLPVKRWSRDDTAIAFWGIGAHIGEAVTQNINGHVLGHVKDIGVDVDDPNNRGHRSHGELQFHNDIGGEIVSLLCLAPSKSGGLSSIVSGAAIHNAMLAERPDLVAELYQPMYFDRRNEVPDGAKPYYAMPVFSHRAGHMTVCFVRRFIESAQRFEELPRLTQLQRDALALTAETAERAELRLDITFGAGDIQFVNNLTTLHARTEYEDYPEPERKRHLLRLWLAVPGGWLLPDAFYERYGSRTPGRRPSGVIADGADRLTPMDVTIRDNRLTPAR